MGKVPRFKTVKEEAEFWETHSPLDFPDEFEEVKEPIVDRRGRKKGIYIRVDPEAIEAARSIGAELGIGYQTLFRMWIMEGLGRYLTRTSDDPLPGAIYSHIATLFSRLPLEERETLASYYQRAAEAAASDPEVSSSGRPSYPGRHDAPPN
jgi:predicted DNA binding CopG/RHH family protein